MTNIDNLDEAFRRFESALRRLEDAAASRADGASRLAGVEEEAESLRRDRARLATELDLLRSKAGALADSSRSAAGKIDAAMSRIRAVLHSNVAE